MNMDLISLVLATKSKIGKNNLFNVYEFQRFQVCIYGTMIFCTSRLYQSKVYVDRIGAFTNDIPNLGG